MLATDNSQHSPAIVDSIAQLLGQHAHLVVALELRTHRAIGRLVRSIRTVQMTIANPTLRYTLVRTAASKRVRSTRFLVTLLGTLVTAINAIRDSIANRRSFDASISVTPERIHAIRVGVARSIRIVRLVTAVTAVVVSIANG